MEGTVSRKKCSDGSLDGLAADGAVGEGGRALSAAYQVAARQKNDSDLVVHAYFAHLLLLQHSVFLFQGHRCQESRKQGLVGYTHGKTKCTRG